MSATMRRTDAKAFFGEAPMLFNVAAGTLVLMLFLNNTGTDLRRLIYYESITYTHSNIYTVSVWQSLMSPTWFVLVQHETSCYDTGL